MAEADELEVIAASVRKRLARISAISKVLSDARLSESQTRGYKIQIGSLKRTKILLYLDRVWDTEVPVLWAGFEASNPNTFEHLLESVGDKLQPVLELENKDTRWIGEQWAFKGEIKRPSDFSPVLEKLGPYFGIYYFGRDEKLFVAEASSFLVSILSRLLELEELDQLKRMKDLKETAREAIILARRGQGKYRDNLSKIEIECRITGVRDPRLLRASHMKPWSLCDNAHERLDGNNGLLLTPTFDLMFDRGYLTFQDNGTPTLSTVLSKAEVALLRMPDLASLKSVPFSDKQKRYLKFHREHIFQSSP